MLVRHRKRSLDSPELNITAFLNLMVVLIPFLLLSAAFSQLSILELYLPVKTEGLDQLDKKKERPQFEIILLENQLILNEKKTGLIVSFPALKGGDINITAMQDVLVKIKARYPEISQIFILASDKISYEKLVVVMDNARAIVVNINGKPSLRELFPDIALGAVPDEFKKK